MNLDNERVIRSLLTTFFCLFFAGFISAQRLPDSDIPAVPISGIVDANNVLGQDTEAAQNIVNMMQNLRIKYGFRIYLICEHSFIGTKVPDLAAQLHEEWLKDGDGLVIVYESDTGRTGIGRDLSGRYDQETNLSKVPSYKLLEIITKALNETEKEQVYTVYLENLIMSMTEQLEGYLQKKQTTKSNGRSLRLALVTIGALSLLALCGMGLGWLIAKSDNNQIEVKTFPLSEIPERLGAPYGGSGGANSFFGIREKQ